KDYIVPKSCEANLLGPRGRTALPTSAESYDKVFVMTQRWGNEYFHFLVENLPRITPMLDVLRENLDIKIAVHAAEPGSAGHPKFISEFLELLGISNDRVIFVQKEIHAVLAILPSSTSCGQPDTQMINMLRHALLQVREALKAEFPTFDIVEFWGIGPIMSQLKLFAAASLIVAPHGAGLSNMVVSSLHTPVLEIGPPICAACYMHLAVKVINISVWRRARYARLATRQLQHIYARHPGSSEWDTPCDGKYEPDVGEILLLVRNLLEGKRQADSADSPKVFGGHF
ncbi:unnamed protein product, partial [Ectocarpus sp. 4 AP-2014]